MRNLFIMVEKYFAKSVFSILCLYALVFAFSCKNQAGGGNGNAQQGGGEKVSVEVKGDGRVTSVTPTSILVDKGKPVGESELKGKFTIQCAAGFEFSKIYYGENADGVQITDQAPYTFKEQGKIYVSTQQIDNEVSLVRLQIGSTNVFPISENMNAGKVNAEKVKIQATKSKKAEEVTFKSAADPQPDASGEWQLNNGVNTLTITVKGDGEEKVYTVTIERVDRPILKKLTVGEKVVEGGALVEKADGKISFSVLSDKSDVEVKIETEPEGAKVECTPALTDGKLTLDANTKTLEITVGEGAKTSLYTVEVNKIHAAATLLSRMELVGGRYRGTTHGASKEQAEQIISGKEDVVVEVCGDTPFLALLPTKDSAEWKKVTVNGQNFEIGKDGGKVILARGSIKLGAKGTITKVDVVIDCNDAGSTDKPKTTLSFFIKRMDVLEDIPMDALIIASSNKLREDKDEDFINLQNEESKPSYTGTDPSLLELQCRYDVIQAVKIDNVDAGSISKKTDNKGDIWYVEKQVKGFEGAEGEKRRDVHIQVIPKDANRYSTLHWYFTIKETAGGRALDYEYSINGKNAVILGGFDGKLREYEEKSYKEKKDSSIQVPAIPEINLADTSLKLKGGKYCNISLQVEQQVKTISINGKDCTLETVKNSKDKDVTRVKKSVKVEQAGTEITIVITPRDDGRYRVTELKFKAKGDGKPETMEPRFEHISNELDLPKDSFLDKLVTTATGNPPTHKVHGNTAEIEISLPEYDYEILCNGGVKFNDQKVELEKKGRRYYLKKSVTVQDSTPTLCTVEFACTDDISQTITWKFNVQGGGALPKFPLNKVTWLSIQAHPSYGGYLKFPSGLSLREWLRKMLENNGPEVLFDGSEATIEVGYETQSADKIKQVMFKVENGATPATEETKEIYPNVTTKNAVAKLEVKNLTQTSGHQVTITIVPTDATKYSNLVLKMVLKPSGKKIPPRLFYVVNDKTAQPSPTKEIKVERGVTTIEVQAKQDLMDEVYIAELSSGTTYTDTASDKVEIKKLKDSSNKDYWSASKVVTLSGDSAKTFVVRVKPKDKSKYDENVDATFSIKGTKFDDNNEEFEVVNGAKAVTYTVTEWTAGMEPGTSWRHYGAKKVTLEALTKSTKASVKWKYVTNDVKDIAGPNGIASGTENTTTKDNTMQNKHTATITLFEDKPTYIKVWVVKQDGTAGTKWNSSDIKTLNNIGLTWDYIEHTGQEGDPYGRYPYANYSFGTITLPKEAKDQVQNGKISVLFVVSDLLRDQGGYSIENPGDVFSDTGDVSNTGKAYRIWVDVAGLLDGSKEEVEQDLKIMKNSKLAFTYKAKIKLAK